MYSTFHEFIWLGTKCYTHSEEDVGSAGNQGRSHEPMSIDKGKGCDPTEHPGHPPESIASNEHASPLPSDKVDSQNNREDMTGLFAKLKELKAEILKAEILKLQNCGPHIV